MITKWTRLTILEHTSDAGLAEVAATAADKGGLSEGLETQGTLEFCGIQGTRYQQLGGIFQKRTFL